MRTGEQSREVYRGGTLVVWVSYGDDGELVVHGQDIGGHPACDEYEYFLRIEPEHVQGLQEALGAPAQVGVVAVATVDWSDIVEMGETTWLKSVGIPYKFDCWMR